MTVPGNTNAIDLVVVSNRQPYRHHFSNEQDTDGETGTDANPGDDDESIVVDRPTGGLTAGLDPVMQRLDGTWIAWGDGDADAAVTDPENRVRVPPSSPSYTLRRVWLDPEAIEGYYAGYSNRVLWPLCHGLPSYLEPTVGDWDAYRSVNELFAGAVVDEADPGSVVWFQDYHLALAPRRVREVVGPEPTLAHFWHIPWPGWETFRICPHRRELVEGLLANDLLGFHVPRYRDNFLRCVEAILEGAFVDRENHRVNYGGQSVAVRTFPMGVDAGSIRDASEGRAGSWWSSFAREHGIPTDTRIALGVERLDYTKGITHRLDALARLFETHPEWRGELTYVQKGHESRSSIPAYRAIQREVRERIDRLNARYGTAEWRPVVEIDDYLPRATLCGLYRHADVAIVSPVRDGMNLVAQEYVAAQVENEGVLVLSELAGAHDRLGEFALTINPYHESDFAETIHAALTMDDEERSERIFRLRQLVMGNDLHAWTDDVLAAIRSTARTDEAVDSHVTS